MGDLHFQVLGSLAAVRADGSEIDLGGPQARLLLARLLAAEGRLVSTDALVDTLWPTGPPVSATSIVQTYVSRLRRAFGPTGPELLRFRDSGYVLEVAADQVDARRFEALARRGRDLLEAGDPDAAPVLRSALDLWRGEVLAGMDADFARSAVSRLHERRLTATEDLFDAELRAGRHVAVASDLAAALEDAPYRERLRALLALALHRSARQADALTVLDDGRRLMRDELGLDPAAELQELRMAILSQDRRLDAPRVDREGPATGPAVHEPEPQTDPRPTAAAQPSEPADAACPVGRQAELAQLGGVLDDVLAGRGSRYVVIDGEPGIGKSTLAHALLDLAARRGATTREAGTLEDGSAPAYGPWLELLRGARERAEPLPGPLQQLLDGRRLLEGSGSAGGVAELAEAVAATAAERAGEHGLVLLLEDLQWADPATVALLQALGPRLGAARVLVVLTVRDLEIGRRDAVVEALAQLTRRAGTRRLTLLGLPPTDSKELIARAAGRPLPAAVVDMVHARSEGNPFFATELARMLADRSGSSPGGELQDSVPSGVRDVLRQRIAQLPAETVSLLETAAVLGRQCAVPLLARVADRPLEQCLDDLEPALLHRLVVTPVDAPGSLRFTHALVRETLAEGMSSLRRARVHLRAADGISATSQTSDDLAEVVAEHLWNAAALGVGDRAAAALERAAQVALRRQALVSAESLLRRAASLYRAAGTDGGLAELRVLRQLGFVGAALHGYAVNADSDLIRRARELARETDRLDILVDLIWADWAGCDTGGQPHRGEQLVAEAEAVVAAVDDPLLQGGVASMRGFTERHFGRMTSSCAEMERAVALFERAGPAQEAGFYLNGYLTSKGYLHWVRALTRGLDAAALERDYLAQDLPFGRIVIALFGAAATMAVGDDAGLDLYSRRMLAADPQMVLSFWSASAELYRAVSLLQSGALRPGLELFARGRTHMREAGGRTMLAGLCASGASALFALGADDDGGRLLHEARQELDEAFEQAYRPVVELAEAHRLVALQDRSRARQQFDLAAALATRQGSHGLSRRIEADRERLLPSHAMV
jgi:DNA-binding SARP family transcriptional activator